MISLETCRTKFWSSWNKSIGTRLKQAILILFVILGCNLKIHAQSDSVRIVQYLTKITKTEGYRNYRNIPLLNQTAEYIFSVFQQYADTVYYQSYQVNGETYKNVVCRLGSANNKPLVVVGAHYDVAGNQEGADDNASAVVGLLELVRLLSKETLNYPIEFVAYTLEEPPFFRTENMGSFVHAKSLYDAEIPVYGMVCLEMIGYFDDNPNSQRFPVEEMKYIYGDVGNFIMLAKQTETGEFVSNFSANFKEYASIVTKSLGASPSEAEGIDFSDHLNYWKLGYDALMITDTAFYRNTNYHKSSDTMETLNIPRMMKVIDATALAIINLK
ncbi:MAG: M28 family peptidase [Paludibacter sp.]|nr:M28 family peptidase [Paludibacter sp.]